MFRAKFDLLQMCVCVCVCVCVCAGGGRGRGFPKKNEES